MSIADKLNGYKSVTLDRQRHDRMQKHMRKLDDIQKGKLDYFKFLDTQRSHDISFSYRRNLKQMSSDFIRAQ